MISKIQKIPFIELCLFLDDKKLYDVFEAVYNKHIDSQLFMVEGKVVFITSLNKNNIFEIHLYFFDYSEINEILKAIKIKMQGKECFLYIRNKEKQKIISSIDRALISKEHLNLSLNKEIKFPTTTVSNSYSFCELKVTKKIDKFFLECFNDEWDENTKKWIRQDFKMCENRKIIGLKVENEIASAIMYWVYKESIYIFLLGTSPKHRRQNLIKHLFNKLQNIEPNKSFHLGVLSDTKAYLLYKKLGFIQESVANVCI